VKTVLVEVAIWADIELTVDRDQVVMQWRSTDA
jgi:hypothetical protein